MPDAESSPYPKQQHLPATTQVITQVQNVQAPSFDNRPVNMTCHHCQQNITTR